MAQSPSRLCYASLVSRVEPVYPRVARDKGIRGTVRLDVVIGKDGRVIRAESISGHPVLVDAARRAVMQWVYQPTLLNSEPIEGVLRVELAFPRRQRQGPERIRCG